ncbi:MAG: type II toxin-antitoxin system HipA family toxin [Lysobacterales bacterium]
MLANYATIEIFLGGSWVPAATLKPVDVGRGYQSASQFEYLLEYATEYAGAATAAAMGTSCRYPVDFDLHRETNWPPFMLDILPSGFGRRLWLEQLELADGPSADWQLLLRGAAFPPGNLRIAEAAAAKDLDCLVPTASGDSVAMRDHPGFTRDEVVARGETFIEYAYQLGIYAAGGSDVQGVAPKLLLAEDWGGAWHAEGRLPDHAVKQHWLMKRPRGNSDADLQVLRNEAAYMRVAAELGLRVHANLDWDSNNLFVPRFDRTVRDKQIVRHGMESLCSLAGVAEFGTRISHDTLSDALLRYSTHPQQDLLEYIKRDVTNVVLGNKDNHARNTAVLRYEDGTVMLAPLFDFAPMYLDPEGIARVCRWEGDAEHAGNPEWAAVVKRFPKYQLEFATQLRTFGDTLQRLPEVMHTCGVDDDIIDHRLLAIDDHAKQLRAL